MSPRFFYMASGALAYGSALSMLIAFGWDIDPSNTDGHMFNGVYLLVAYLLLQWKCKPRELDR